MASSWNLKKILKPEWQIIHDSPARRENFMSVTSCSVVSLPFCGTRWVENKKVADRTILIWPHMVEIVRIWQKLVPSKQLRRKSYTTLKDTASDTLMIPKLLFFTYVASVLEPSLRLYQTDVPMIPSMFSST